MTCSMIGCWMRFLFWSGTGEGKRDGRIEWLHCRVMEWLVAVVGRTDRWTDGTDADGAIT